jgi:uncharacterized protein (DUF885 family)
MDRRTVMIGTAFAALFASARAWPHRTDSSKLLNALFDQFMKENLDLSPVSVTNLGMDTGARATQKSEIDDGSEAGIERQRALIASQLARLTAFDRASLSASAATSYDVVMYGLRTTDVARLSDRDAEEGLSRCGCLATAGWRSVLRCIPRRLGNHEQKACRDSRVGSHAG